MENLYRDYLNNIGQGCPVNETIGNAIGSVLGLDKVQENALYGTWSYNGPGCAFTSENALAKAGGEVAATEVRQKLKTQYDKLGFTRSNTWITLNKDHSFSAKIDGKSFNGTFTFDQQNQQLKLNGLLLNLTAYTKRTTTCVPSDTISRQSSLSHLTMSNSCAASWRARVNCLSRV